MAISTGEIHVYIEVKVPVRVGALAVENGGHATVPLTADVEGAIANLREQLVQLGQLKG